MSLYCSSCLSICLYTRPSPFFSNAFPDIGSVGQIKKKKLKKKHKKSQNGRPGTTASLLWRLETTRHEPKFNMAEKDDVKS